MGALNFAGLEFRGLTRDVLFVPQESLKVIITVNAEFIVLAHEDERFRNIVNQNFATFDGEWPYRLARRRHPHARIEKISGSDFIYDICEFARANGRSVFLLGAAAEVNCRAVQILGDKYKIRIGGFSPTYKAYPFSADHNNAMLARISGFRPDFLLVALGAPKQEFWIEDNRRFLEQSGVKWAVGVGGTLDFVSGKSRRAPMLVRRAGLEGIWRLAQNPRQRVARFLKVLTFLRYV